MTRLPKPKYISRQELKTRPIIELIAIKMRNLRIEHELTQEELAYDSNVDRAYIGQIERCEKNVTVATLQKIANSFSLEVYEFLNFSDLVQK